MTDHGLHTFDGQAEVHLTGEEEVTMVTVTVTSEPRLSDSRQVPEELKAEMAHGLIQPADPDRQT